MQITKTIFLLAILLSTRGLHAQQTNNDESVVRLVADRIIKDAVFEFEGTYDHKTYKLASEIPDTTSVRLKSGYAGWGYPNGVLNMSMINLGKALNDTKYSDYAQQQLAFVFDNYKKFEDRYKKTIPGGAAGSEIRPSRGIPFGSFFYMRELDDCGAMGASLIDAYQTTNRTDYRAYIDKAANHISKIQERLSDGTLVRRSPYAMTLWADDLYMSVPFLARMGKLTDNNKYFDDAAKQVLNFSKYLWDDNKGLYYHCYYDDLKRNGVAYWGRCNGWIMIAQVHLLSFMPRDHPQRANIIKNLERQILGVAKYQNGDGLWHQVLDKSDSYLESSCSAMFTYAIAKAVNEGWIDKRYASISLVGWNGLKKFKITEDGQMKDVCVGTGISNDIAFYYNRPAILNDTHGTGSLLDAGVEIIRYKKNNPQRGN